MFQERTILISLDIYDTTIVSVVAKQYDTSSRFIEAICTENGTKINLDSETFKAIVVCNKPDDTVVVNNATILSNGNVLIELTQQMLAVAGQCSCDLMILAASGEINVENETDINMISSYALSTMTFQLNVVPFATSNEIITSTNDFKTFVDAINVSIAVEKDLKNAEALRVEAENKRQDGITGETFRIANENIRIQEELKRQDNITGEAYRIANENIRIQEELKRQDNVTGEAYRIANELKRQDDVTGEAYRIANEEKRQDNITGEAYRIANEEKRQDNITGEAYRIANETERQRIFGKETDSVDNGTMYGVMNSTKQLIEEGNDVIEETQNLLGTKDDSSDVDTLYGIQKALQESVVDGDKAAQRANEAAQKCEDVAAGTGIVFTTDIANNLTTTEIGKVLDATQGTELLAMITALQETIDNMPKVHTGTTDPDNSLGNNGDYYLKLLTEE